MESTINKNRLETIAKILETQNTVIVIAGPTASGKSALAFDLAQEIGGVIVNCDSMQVYQNLPIITACPSSDERKIIEHRLYEICHPSVRGNVVDWLKAAVQEIRKIWTIGKIPIVVGGTGLYIDNLINGTTPIPETTTEVREKALLLLKTGGTKALLEKLKEVDPESAERLKPNDSVRLLRAYEVWADTGIPLSQWHKKPMIKHLPEANYTVIKICPEAAPLNSRCDLRFDKMVRDGALEEVQQLKKLELDPSLPAMKALGVPELLAYLQGACDLDSAVNLAKVHTRQYAKRQRTWFRNKLKADIEIMHIYSGDVSEINEKFKSAMKVSGGA